MGTPPTTARNQPRWSTFPKPDAPTARARIAESTPSTRSRNTRQERHLFSRKESVVMIASSPVTVVRQSCVPQEGKDDQEGCVETGVHSLQDEGTIGVEALQAFRAWWWQEDQGCCAGILDVLLQLLLQ